MFLPSQTTALVLSVLGAGPTQEPADAGAERPLLEVPEATVPYTSFDGARLDLHPWRGEAVAFLTRSRELDPATMTRLVEVFDAVHAFYREATGRLPRPARTFEGRLTIAEVEETCGAGCGYLGHTGIELMPATFAQLYDGVRRDGRIDQALPYEFGRNFWFLGDKLEYRGDDETGSVTTGYAVLMRFWALEAAGCGVGPFRGSSGDEFLAEVEGLAGLYEADRKASWKRTLAKGQGVPNRMGLGATDLFASFLMRARRESLHADFPTRVWRFAAAQPDAGRTEDAVDNLVVAASLAAGKDLSELFDDAWRFPVSRDARKRIATGLGELLEPDGTRDVALMRQGGAGAFRLEGAPGVGEPAARVLYRVPERVRPNAPVLVVLPDREIDADVLLRAFDDPARNAKAVLLVLVLSQERDPTRPPYERAGPEEVAPPVPSLSGAQAVEAAFDVTRRTLELKADGYALVGLGAGGQLAQRMVLCLPAARLRAALAVHADWYTLPDPGIAWPQGLLHSDVDEATLPAALERELIVLVDRDDTAADDPRLRGGEEIQRQGLHRLARAQAFLEQAQRLAEQRAARLGWRLEVVPGLGRNPYRVAPVVARLLRL